MRPRHTLHRPRLPQQPLSTEGWSPFTDTDRARRGRKWGPGGCFPWVLPPASPGPCMSGSGQLAGWTEVREIPALSLSAGCLAGCLGPRGDLGVRLVEPRDGTGWASPGLWVLPSGLCPQAPPGDRGSCVRVLGEGREPTWAPALGRGAQRRGYHERQSASGPFRNPSLPAGLGREGRAVGSVRWARSPDATAPQRVSERPVARFCQKDRCQGPVG